jgi:hypothetical protein
VPITEAVVVAATANVESGENVLKLLIARRDRLFPVTETVVSAISRGCSETVIRLLLDRRGDQVPVTTAIVKATATNTKNGEQIMKTLLDRRSDQFPVTEVVTSILVRDFSEQVMQLLLDRRGIRCR